jgi:hypothetical protein
VTNRQRLTESDHIFDGFAHRRYTEELDGWRSAQPDAVDYPCVQAAMDTIELFNELRVARRRIWELEQEAKDRAAP